MEQIDYICLECGNVQSFPINSFKKKKICSLEDIFCFECQEITKHMNVGDLKTFLEWNKSEEAKIVNELIEKRKFHGR